MFLNLHETRSDVTWLCFCSKVCSGYFLTDCLLALDDLFQGKMLVGASGSKLDMAAEEAVKLKKLMGAVRALWRSSPSGQHPRVSELKGMLRPSPSRKRLPASPNHGSDVTHLMFETVLS